MYESHLNGWRREDQNPSRASLIASQPDFSDLRKKMSSYIPPTPGMITTDLRKFSPPQRHDQSWSNSCVVNSTTRALENKRIKKFYDESIISGSSEADSITQAQLKHVPLSRLSLYFLCRESMSPPETDSDHGTYVSVAADLLQKFGISRESKNPLDPNDDSFWPFDLNKIFVSPSWSSMRDAYLHKISSWSRITSRGSDRVDDVITNLSVGNAVVFGTTVGDNWMKYNGGILSTVNGTIKGNHATMLCGWDPSGFFWDENSWGNGWGIDGFCKVSPEVISSSDSEDFIVISGGWEEWHNS